MKTGNKRFIALLCAVLILVGLVGCGAEPEVEELKTEIEELKKEVEELKTETEETTAPEKENSIQYFDFYFELSERLDEVKDDYKITKLLPTVYNDEDDTVQPFVVEDALLGDTCHIRAHYNADGEIIMVEVNGDKESIANFTFALLSIYVYESLGLPEYEDFYEKFNLLEEEPSGYLEPVPNWTASAHTIDDLLMFVVSYK